MEHFNGKIEHEKPINQGSKEKQLADSGKLVIAGIIVLFLLSIYLLISNYGI